MAACGMPVVRSLCWVQVQPLVSCPSLLEHPEGGKLFPRDVVAQAKHMLTLIPGGIGAC